MSEAAVSPFNSGTPPTARGGTEVGEKTVEQVAAEALASWKAAHDSGPGEASMRAQLQASTAVRQRRESDERAAQARDYENARRSKSGLPPLLPIQKAPKNEWERREAEIEAEHKQAQADRAAAESRRKEQESYLSFVKSRYELARKNGNHAVADVWYSAAEATVRGEWLHHPIINSDPAVTRFQSYRSRLALSGKAIRG